MSIHVKSNGTATVTDRDGRIRDNVASDALVGPAPTGQALTIRWPHGKTETRTYPTVDDALAAFDRVVLAGGIVTKFDDALVEQRPDPKLPVGNYLIEMFTENDVEGAAVYGPIDSHAEAEELLQTGLVFEDTLDDFVLANETNVVEILQAWGRYVRGEDIPLNDPAMLGSTHVQEVVRGDG